jgi:predicted dithiol-disulfide oxidoreductase (DUF899 family)
MSLPDVVSREEWLQARTELLAREKELTKVQAALNADRRRLPMVKVDKEYVFTGPKGQVTLAGLFGDKRQLIIQHVMFGPEYEAPCPGCSAAINELSPGILDHLASRDTTFVLASRAPYDRIAAAAAERGWFAPWYSTEGSDFNYDYRVTLDASRGQLEYNYRPEPDAVADQPSAERPGYSCFLRAGASDDASIFHTYSVFARGTEYVGNAYTFLDMTALGRQEDWEEPNGRVAAVRAGDPTFTS